MTFLPIVERELRVRGRSKATYRFRVLAAALASLFAGVLLLASETARASASIGVWMFYVLGGAAFLYCLSQGLRNTADCLSEEKRAGTLGLLFLTDLRGYDVVLGKLMATSLTSFYMLLAVFPPLGIPLVLGGVTAGEFWRLVLTLICTLVFSLTTGMFVSSISRDARRAWSGTVLLTGFFVVLVPLLQPLGVVPASPTCAFLSLADANYLTRPGEYWTAVGGSLLLSLGFLIAASVILPRAWQDRPASARGARTGWLAFGRAPRDAPENRATRQRLLEVNPVVWLAARGERQSFLVWAAILAGSTVAAVVWLLAGGGKAVSISILVIFILLHLLLSMWVASEACAVFPTARDTGALELLLSTPLTVREIVDGHILGMTRLFQRPLVALLALELALFVGYLALGVRRGMAGQEIIFTQLGVTLIVGIAVMDVYAVSRYGMWAGLTAKKPGWAVTKTILLVLVMPLVLTMSCTMCGLALWPVVGVVKNLIFIAYAEDQLRRRFRELVTERHSQSTGEATLPKLSRRQIEAQLPPVLPG